MRRAYPLTVNLKTVIDTKRLEIGLGYRPPRITQYGQLKHGRVFKISLLCLHVYIEFK